MLPNDRPQAIISNIDAVLTHFHAAMLPLPDVLWLPAHWVRRYRQMAAWPAWHRREVGRACRRRRQQQARYVMSARTRARQGKHRRHA